MGYEGEVLYVTLPLSFGDEGGSIVSSFKVKLLCSQACLSLGSNVKQRNMIELISTYEQENLVRVLNFQKTK